MWRLLALAAAPGVIWAGWNAAELAHLHRWRPRADTPEPPTERRYGAAIVLRRPGEAERRYGNPAQPFQIGSITKTFTALLLADAVDRGEVSLDDTLGARLGIGGAAAGVTLRALAGHRSGLPRMPGGRAGAVRSIAEFVAGINPYRWSEDEVVSYLGTLPRLGPAVYHYSNLGAAAVGIVLARASGLTYAELLDARICGPLGLTGTFIATDSRPGPAGHSVWGWRWRPWVLRGMAPCGGIVSTAADLARFTDALLERRAPGIAAIDAHFDKPAMGLFWMIDDQVLWHNGATLGFHSMIGIDRRSGASVIALAGSGVGLLDPWALRMLRAAKR